MVIFSEVQYMRRVWWVMLLVLGVTGLMWWGFIQQIIFGQPWGNNPSSDWMMWLLWLIFGIGFPLAFLLIRLEVTVFENNVVIRYVPLTKRNILFTDVEQVEARTYKPLQEYGGWGIRGRSGRRAYNVSGNRGAELTLRDGNLVMVGSQKAEELALAIEGQLPK
jgi:hypothetical protein